jgi:two-component system phosphate regulon response regulator PhoB
MGVDRPAKRRILVIEDDAALTEILEFNLRRDGYEVRVASDGAAGWRHAQAWNPDLVILDLMLPNLDGIDVCRRLRADFKTRHIAVLMLTAKSEEVDQVEGFSVGADDYVTKPFSVKVLLQRIRSLLYRRRACAGDGAEAVERHGIRLDQVGHQVLCAGVPVALTPTEYRLLETLMLHPGRAFTRIDLLNAAVGEATIVLERTADVHIRSLRQKLGKAGQAIQTVRGVGYRFARDLTTTSPRYASR